MIGYIYCYTSKTSGKKYIGQTTKTLIERAGKNGTGYDENYKFGQAIKKYGWNDFISEILETIEADSDIELAEQLNNREIFWIAKYDTYRHGYNSDLGGCHHILTDESKNKIRVARLGKAPWNKGKTGVQKAWNKGFSLLPNICMYDKTTGNLLIKFTNGNEAARYLDSHNEITTSVGTAATRIFTVCKAGFGHAYNYIWRFDNNIEKLDEKEVLRENISPRAKAILQYDLENNFISEYISAAAYSKTITNDYEEQRKIAHTISDVCNNKKDNAYGYIWKFKNL